MSRKLFSFIIILCMLGFLIGGTFIKINKKHVNALWEVTNKEVLEAASRCQRENVCNTDTATLQFLIEQGYLKDVVNPITKEYINNDSYVDFNNNEFVIVE